MDDQTKCNINANRIDFEQKEMTSTRRRGRRMTGSAAEFTERGGAFQLYPLRSTNGGLSSGW